MAEAGADDAAGGVPPAVSLEAAAFARRDPPLWAVTLWPHQSMTRGGFRFFMAALAAGLAIPLLAVLGAPGGSAAALFLSPFVVGALGLVWAMVRLNVRRRRLTEAVRLWPDAMAVERREPGGRVLRWAANPYWVRVELEDTPTVERYLTVSGGPRLIELGAFLTPEERVALAVELRAALRRARGAAGPVTPA
ncbi:DUF2244 domain-containing protein [Rubrimonas cliftonensis]|uniref:Uncharacterized membrane protein n=1 Tax=Rubrimonas cliftonensis TaxID=89524 RepID=A0A1H3VE69_9RHOB|nr:DUF2244 domain-containing protein [Rubrimonas cliftonensis]SDZ72961.1 Uncharacterized membrane protein [Rubrimonas cliftonensis]